MITVDVCGFCGLVDDDESGPKMKFCTGCRSVKYCSKRCLVKDWTEGGHKEKCQGTRKVTNIL